MLYIYKAACISPQQTFDHIDLTELRESADNKLQALEPKYEGIPANVLRRMSKTVKLGLTAAAALIDNEQPPAGIVMGTGNGGMEESGRFLNQIVEYNEDLLTPGNFVQSTPNTVTSQLCMLLKRKEYNITHVQRGLSFETAMLDVAMLLKEHPEQTYLLGGVDEIASYNHEIDKLAGWFRQATVSNRDLYRTQASGSIAGEGAAVFLTGNQPDQAIASVKAIQLFHTTNLQLFKSRLQQFIREHTNAGQPIDVLLSGESGDDRQAEFYTTGEELISAETTIARFKHMSGEYPTASAFALWLACRLVTRQIDLPVHVVKRQGKTKACKTILIHNTHKGAQHSFMLVKSVF